MVFLSFVRIFQAACALTVGCIPFVSLLLYKTVVPEHWLDESGGFGWTWFVCTAAIMVAIAVSVAIVDSLIVDRIKHCQPGRR